jgi:demethylmenaquinone methyltransferase/2-methoxy-6-polyprenyl-1,4-benzoquinol methylase
VAAPADSQASPRKRHAVELFRGLPRSYHAMGALLSFGQDPRWRQMVVEAIAAEPGERVLDVATGTGLVAFAHARRGAEVVGLDQSEAMVAVARAALARAQSGPGRVAFVVGEAERLPFADREFDALSFTYLLRYVDDREATTRELVRVLKPGGRIAMLEFGVPATASLRAAWRLYTRLGLPLLGRMASRAWFEAGRFLGPSIERLYAEEPDLAALWARSGIVDVELARPSFGAAVVISGRRGGEPV